MIFFWKMDLKIFMNFETRLGQFLNRLSKKNPHFLDLYHTPLKSPTVGIYALFVLGRVWKFSKILGSWSVFDTFFSFSNVFP